MGRMEKKMKTTILGLGFRVFQDSGYLFGAPHYKDYSI